VNDVEAGTVWFSVILPDGETGDGAGTVCVWDHDWNGKPISEIGWMVLPEFQGRGLAAGAVRSILQRARSEGRWDVVHAFPVVTNAPSNAIWKDGILEARGAGHRVLGRDLAMQPLAHRPSFRQSCVTPEPFKPDGGGIYREAQVQGS
jgi:hypothetical protein